MARRRTIRAIDLPTIRDQVRGLALGQAPLADRPEQVRELARQASRPDFALWWVARPMAILAAHAALTVPEWDGVVSRPAVAGVMCWEGGSGIGLPVWRPGHLAPHHIEAVGMLWWSAPDADEVVVEPLAWASDVPGFAGPPGTLLTPLDRAGQGLAVDWELARQTDARVGDLWVTTAALALEPKVGTTHAHGKLPGMKWPDRPKHRSKITIVELRQRPETPRGQAGDDPEREASWHLTHQHLVRGHWRQQACGPGRKLRRPVFVAPYIKGPTGADLAATDVVHVWRR